MSKQRLLRLLSLLLAFGLVAAACGGSDSAGSSDGETSTEDEGAGGIDNEEADDAVANSTTTEATDDTMAEATTMEELEAQWEANREAQIKRINDEGFGLGDDGIVTGPGGFTMDTNVCPADWSDTQGVTDTEVLLGLTIAQSGNLASYGNILAGMRSYFGYVNANGGIGGRDIVIDAKDDAYVATQTIELVDELLQSVKPFTIQTLGSPNTLAVYDTLNEKCVPQPLVMTGHPAWGDPVNHPWTTGDQMSYATEAILWGAWIKNNMADQLPVTVSGLVMDNDFGLAYEDGMKKYADANPDVIESFTPVRHDPAAPTVTNEMTTIAASNPDVFISMTAGNPCLLAVEEAGRSGMTEGETVLFAPSVCKSATEYMVPAGEAADGWYIVGGGQKIFSDPQYADDPFVKFANETMAADGLDISIGNNATGFGLFAWPYVEALRVANELEGGLTRTNFILALRTLQGNAPFLIDGVSFGMDGNDDAYFIEGSDFSIYDAANESWVTEGAIVDLNGSSPNCTWGADGCS